MVSLPLFHLGTLLVATPMVLNLVEWNKGKIFRQLDGQVEKCVIRSIIVGAYFVPFEAFLGPARDTPIAALVEVNTRAIASRLCIGE